MWKFSWRGARDLDQTSMKDISLGSQSWMKLNATIRHICVKICIMKVNIWLGRTNTWSCKAMEVFFLIKSPDTKADKARILPLNHISLVNN